MRLPAALAFLGLVLALAACSGSGGGDDAGEDGAAGTGAAAEASGEPVPEGETITVGCILDDCAGFHGRLTRDPLEPGYDGGRATGKLFLMDSRPTLFSFAHHGRSFRLVRSPERIEVVRGRLAAATESALGILRNDPAVFDFGGQVALVEDGRMLPLDEHALGYHLAGGVQFWQQRKNGGGREIVYVGGREYRKSLVGGELTLSNHRKEAVKLVIRRRFSGELLTAEGAPRTMLREEGVWSVNRRNELVWTVTLQPGEEKRLTYQYSVLVLN